MTRSQKKALRFAYALLRGDHDNDFLPYVHAVMHRYQSKRRGEWIEPDRDPKRPYLNEAVLSALALRGYFTCEEIEGKWLYRLTKRGCEAMGWDWPLTPNYTVTINRRPNRRITQNLTPFQGRHSKRPGRNNQPFHDDFHLRHPRKVNPWKHR